MINAAFYNRKRERGVLCEALTSSRSEMIILYGRRGVGKSALMAQAVTEVGLPAIFYKANRRTLPLQLEALTDAVREAYPDAFLEQPFNSIEIFLNFLSYMAEQSQRVDGAPVILVIDELPYLADVEPGLLTMLQHWWDANKRRPNLKIFLAGSYISFMERQVLDANAPLYNRRTGAMKLEPMDYFEASLFFPEYSPEEKMTVWAILGGLPSYLEQFSPDLNIETNVRMNILRQNTYLSEEPEWLLLEDIRRDAVFGSILRAVARGARKPSDIARAIGKSSASDISPMLPTLIGLGLLVRETPVTQIREPKSRQSLYFVADQYLDFWYRFVDPARSLVSRGMGDLIWDRNIAGSLNEYVSYPAFERASRQYLWQAYAAGRLPEGLNFTELGSWWGAGDREIDVVATDEYGHVSLAGSCKWTNAPVDVREYSDLQRDVALARFDDANPMLALFSRSGFTPRLQELTAARPHGGIMLVDLVEMYNI